MVVAPNMNEALFAQPTQPTQVAEVVTQGAADQASQDTLDAETNEHSTALVTIGGESYDLAAFGLMADTIANNPLAMLDSLNTLGQSVPWVVIEQKPSKEAVDNGRIAGLWTHAATGEQKDALDLVLVTTLAQRSFRLPFDPNAEQQKPPVCRSLDGVRGCGSGMFDVDFGGRNPFAIPSGRLCEKCEFSQWKTDPATRKRSQACGDIHVLICHEVEWGPIAIPIRRTGIPPLRKAKNAWFPTMQRVMAQRAKAKKPAVPANLVVHFPAKLEKKGTANTYYVPAFGTVNEIDENRLTDILLAADLFGALREQIMHDDSLDQVDNGDPEQDDSFDPEQIERQGHAQPTHSGRSHASTQQSARTAPPQSHEPPPPDDDDYRAPAQPSQPSQPRNGNGGNGAPAGSRFGRSAFGGGHGQR